MGVKVLLFNIGTLISSPSSNTDIVKLEKPPKIAVYSPKNG